MTRVIAVCTQKGGVGKTTTVSNLAAAWGRRGRRLLVIDLDPQFALTRRFGVDPGEMTTIVDVLEAMLLKKRRGPEMGESIVEAVIENVDLIPSHRRLADVELSLAPITRRERFLARALTGAVDDYDVVLIDCPPNLGLLTVNGLCAAQEAIVPIDMKAVDALAGAEELSATVADLEDDGPQITALVRNRVEGSPQRRRLVYRAIDEALPALELPIANTSIPATDEFEKAAIMQIPLVTWQPDHSGSIAFDSLVLELEQAAA